MYRHCKKITQIKITAVKSRVNKVQRDWKIGPLDQESVLSRVCYNDICVKTVKMFVEPGSYAADKPGTYRPARPGTSLRHM